MIFDSSTRWYVMTHLEMAHFMKWLKSENAQRLSQEKSIIEPFYPYEFLKETKNGVSNDFTNIVFLKATESDISNLVNHQNDMVSRLRLRHYLDTDGTKATISDKIMQEFIQVCINYRGHFEVVPPISSIEATDKVKIISGPFAGNEASVVRVRLSHGAIHLDLAVELLSGVMHIRMNDVDKNKITILNRNSVDVIRNDFIEYTQNHLLAILKHRIDHEESIKINKRDADMLTRLYRYRNHDIKNDAARNHFLALMLICAHLCHYTADEEQLRKNVLSALTEINQRSESKAATDVRAYLWIALYISTHDPVYRDAVKQYVHDRQPKSVKLRNFVSLIRIGRKV